MRFLLALSIVFSCTIGLVADPILDQGFDTGVQGGNAVFDEQWLTQSFQVGIGGTLQQIKVHLFRGGVPLDDLTAYIALEGTLDYIASAPIPIASVPRTSLSGIPGGSMVTVDFGTQAPDLQLNSRFQILLISSHSVGGAVNWTRDLNDQYDLGIAGVFRPPDNTWSQAGDGAVDHTFQTFMVPKIVKNPPSVIGTAPEPALGTLPGDANNDGLVTGVDFVTINANFGHVETGSPTGTLPGDANDDGQVTGADLISVQQNFGDVEVLQPSHDPNGTLDGDANDDGLVTGADLIAVQQRFGKTGMTFDEIGNPADPQFEPVLQVLTQPASAPVPVGRPQTTGSNWICVHKHQGLPS